MKVLALVLVLATTTTAAQSIPLIGVKGVGHACPTEIAVFTARHVVEDKNGTLHSFASPSGVLTPKWVDDVRDLATLTAPGIEAMPRYKLADSVRQGEKVWWTEFSFDGDKIFSSERKKAKVLRSVAGHIVFDKAPEGGASGACLMNEAGRVVGIVVWRWPAGGTQRKGVAVDLTGSWRPEE